MKKEREREREREKKPCFIISKLKLRLVAMGVIIEIDMMNLYCMRAIKSDYIVCKNIKIFYKLIPFYFISLIRIKLSTHKF